MLVVSIRLAGVSKCFDVGVSNWKSRQLVCRELIAMTRVTSNI